MSERMVRKQIYLPRRQNLTLKRLAKQRGISEAEALDKIFAYAESLRKRPEFMRGKPYKFNRDELYEERESRWVS